MKITRRGFFGRLLYGGALWVLSPWPRPERLEAAEPTPVPEALPGNDREIVRAITARILPTDDEPGAIEAGCIDFIVETLRSEDGASREIYRAGLHGLGAVCLARFERSFLELRPDEQDEVLASLQSGEVEAWPAGAVSPRRFFETVRLHTIHGFLADPKYGGNRGYAGWKVAAYTAPRNQSGYTARQLLGEDRIRTIWEKPLPRKFDE